MEEPWQLAAARLISRAKVAGFPCPSPDPPSYPPTNKKLIARSSWTQLRSQLLAGSVGVVLAVLIVGGAVDVVSRSSAGPVALYDIPNFIAERTQTHFPQVPVMPRRSVFPERGRGPPPQHHNQPGRRDRIPGIKHTWTSGVDLVPAAAATGRWPPDTTCLCYFLCCYSCCALIDRASHRIRFSHRFSTQPLNPQTSTSSPKPQTLNPTFQSPHPKPYQKPFTVHPHT